MAVECSNASLVIEAVFLKNPDWIILEARLILKKGNINDIKNL